MPDSTNADLLSLESVGDYLIGLGMLAGRPDSARVLSGGVSSRVIAVRAAGQRLVVKQALPRLAVAEEWIAPVGRVLNEGAAMVMLGAITPNALPAVLATDPERNAIVIELAPDGWTDWKSQLLQGNASVAVANFLGATLAHWHSRTADAPIEPALQDLEIFDILRLDPYHRTVAERVPEATHTMEHLITELREQRQCLVHGDFSPKNVLTGSGGSWVIDFEVAHLGNPVFDLAFMINHLTLKAIHRGHDATAYDACRGQFLTAYREHVSPGLLAADRSIAQQVGALLLARVVGKSPAEYLDERQRRQAYRLGLDLTLDPPDRLDELTDRRETLS